MRVIQLAGGKSGGRVALRAQSSGRLFCGGSAPWLEEVEFKRLVVLMALGTAAISSWFVAAATVRIPELPPDAFFYVHQLPPVSWSLRVLRPTDCCRGDRSFPADEILPFRDLSSACLPDLCDCEKLRPQLRSYLYSFHSQRFLVSASPLSAEPGTNSILWCSIPAPKDHRGPGPEETLDSHRHRGHAGSGNESS